MESSKKTRFNTLKIENHAKQAEFHFVFYKTV